MSGAIPLVDSLEAATVIVGAFTESSGPKTFGTGFVISYANTVYVVTCKHVIAEASSPDLFVIARPMKTKSPPGGYTPVRLGKPIYHPTDTDNLTQDIAVLKIANVSRESFQQLGIRPLVLESSRAATREGTRLAAAGYPVEYADTELSLGVLEPLRPLRSIGTVKSVPIEDLTQRGFGATLAEAYFAQTAEPLGKGASGGPVYLEGHEDVVVGVLLGFADLKITKDGRTSNLSGFVFASSVRVVETLDSNLRSQHMESARPLDQVRKDARPASGAISSTAFANHLSRLKPAVKSKKHRLTSSVALSYCSSPLRDFNVRPLRSAVKIESR